MIFITPISLKKVFMSKSDTKIYNYALFIYFKKIIIDVDYLCGISVSPVFVSHNLGLVCWRSSPLN